MGLCVGFFKNTEDRREPVYQVPEGKEQSVSQLVSILRKTAEVVGNYLEELNAGGINTEGCVNLPKATQLAFQNEDKDADRLIKTLKQYDDFDRSQFDRLNFSGVLYQLHCAREITIDLMRAEIKLKPLKTYLLLIEKIIKFIGENPLQGQGHSASC